ncbi:MAG: zinc ribbon domain-containing protein [Paludibaculum sp.]
MPIFEYACEDCGTKFEKLIRRESDYETLGLPLLRRAPSAQGALHILP